MPDQLPPYTIEHAKFILPGEEADQILEVGPRFARKIVKEVTPDNFYLPNAVRDRVEQIHHHPYLHAMTIARYKKSEYEALKTALGEHITATQYILLRTHGSIKIGVIQEPVRGVTIRKLVDAGPLALPVEKALERYLDLLNTVKQSGALINHRSLGTIPTMEQIKSGYDNQTCELTYLSNLIYDEQNDQVVAIDW